MQRSIYPITDRDRALSAPWGCDSSAYESGKVVGPSHRPP